MAEAFDKLFLCHSTFSHNLSRRLSIVNTGTIQFMHVAVAHINLRVPESRSLKTRRQAARSLIQRIRGRFNVSVAQDAGADGNAWQSVTLAISCVGVSADQTRSLVDDVVDFVIEVRPDLEVLDYQIEVMSGF